MVAAALTITRLALDDLRLDGGTQVRAQIDAGTAEDYAAALLAGQLLPPVTVVYDGAAYWLADGFHRVAAAQLAGFSDITASVRHGTRRDAVLFACGANASHGLRRTNADKRRAVETLLRDPEWCQWSDREIARRCGVSQPLVTNLRTGALTDNGYQSPDRTYTTKHGTVATMATTGINGSRGAGAGPPAVPEPEPEDERAGQPQPGGLAVHFSSASPEWYTPPAVIDLVLRVLGAIDLDPCSNSHETPNVPAARHYTRVDDGLAQPWMGRVYLNPPYGDVIGAWVERLVNAFAVGDVPEAIALLPARTDTRWFRRLRDAELCFVAGRLRFSDSDQAAPFPSVLAYLGRSPERFAAVFGEMGDVWTRQR